MTQPTSPNLRLWTYQRIALGKFRRVSRETADQWFRGMAPLPPSADGFVWLVEIVVLMRNRRPIRFRKFYFLKHRVNAEGFHEKEMQSEEERATVVRFLSRLFSRSSSQGAEALDPKGRSQYQWTPTRADLEGLRGMLHTRVGGARPGVATEARGSEGKSEVSRPPSQFRERKSAPLTRSRKPPTLTPRRLSTRPPAPFTANGPRTSPEVVQARQEKAVKVHHALLMALQQSLEGAGWEEIQEIPGALDLWARSPMDDRRVIFEAKTLGVANKVTQTRMALAQLLEYRHAYGEPGDNLCLVINDTISDERQQILADFGVAVLVYRGTSFHPIGTLAREWFADLARS